MAQNSKFQLSYIKIPPLVTWKLLFDGNIICTLGIMGEERVVVPARRPQRIAVPRGLLRLGGVSSA